MGDQATDLVSIGKTVKGKDARLHPIAAAAFNAWADLAKARLGINIRERIIQAYGTDVAASAGVHDKPACAVDLRIWGLSKKEINALVLLGRECGWAATFYRPWLDNEHIHAATDIGIDTPALYQVKAVKAGYDGLGKGGKAGKDPHEKPSKWRTAQEGTQWAREQLGGWLDMDEKQLRKIIQDELKGFKGEVKAAARAALFERLAPDYTGEDPILSGSINNAIYQGTNKTRIKEAVNEALWEPVVPAQKGKGLIGSSWRNVLWAVLRAVAPAAAAEAQEAEKP